MLRRLSFPSNRAGTIFDRLRPNLATHNTPAQTTPYIKRIRRKAEQHFRRISPLRYLLIMSQLTPAALVESLKAPAQEQHIQGPKHIWRAHGTKGAFVPTTPATTNDSTSSSAASSSSSASVAPRIIPPGEIDKSRFVESVTTVALKIAARKCGAFQAHFRARPHLLYSRPRIGTIIDGPTKDEKYLLLSVKSFDELATSVPIETLEFIQKEGGQAVLFTFQLDYDYFTLDYILRKLLPENIQVPAGFETIGHIAHLNMAEEQRPYGPIIARVILDKNAHIHTVVNKVGAIASEFRVFQMEVLGGVDSFWTEVKEHGCTFQFDFSKVYWNSRLSTEHARLIDLFRRKELVVDAMCGIGPFVVPGAKKLGYQKDFLQGQPAILANDLNPDSYAALCSNLDRNKVASLVSCHNMDGRAFLWEVLRKKQLEAGPYQGQRAAHVLMNLPAIAIEFLDAFIGLYAPDPSVSPDLLTSLLNHPPLVHVYCFSREIDNPLIDLVPRVEKALGGRKMPKPVLVKEQLAPQVNIKKEKKEKKAQQSAKHKKEQANGRQQAESSSSSSSLVELSSTSSSSSSSSPAVGIPPLGESHIRFVRNVAPNKDMFCISFHIPVDVLTATPTWKEMQENIEKTNSEPNDSTSLKRKLECDSQEDESPALKKSKE